MKYKISFSFLIVVSIVGILLMIWYYASYGHKTFVTGTVEVSCKDSFLKIDDITARETVHNEKVILWEDDDTIYYKLETQKNKSYNIQITVSGNNLNVAGLRGKVLYHNFSMSMESENKEGDFDIMIEYYNKYENWLAEIQLSGMIKANLLQEEVIQSKEVFFIEKQSQTKTIFW